MGFYGEQGYTRTPEVRGILDRYDEMSDDEATERRPIPGGGVFTLYRTIPFSGLAAIDFLLLRRAVRLFIKHNDDGEDGPILSCLERMATRWPSATFDGYRAPPPRDDERIVISAARVPWDIMTLGDLFDATDGQTPLLEMGTEQIVREDGQMVFYW